MNILLRLTALVFVILLIGSSVSSVCLVGRGATQNPPGESKKKKLPPGARGFEQFAGRDAADKLIKGAATRRHSPAPPAGATRIPELVRQLEAALREGEKQYAVGNFEAAIAAYKKAIELSEDDALGELQYTLGKIYSDMERYEDAVIAFQAASTRPSSGDVTLYPTYELGNAYLDLGKYAEAIREYEKALKILNGEWKTSEPTLSAAYLPSTHYNMGLAHLGLKQKERAVTDFEKVIELNPDFPEAYFNLGLTHWQLGRAKVAKAQQMKLKTLNPELASKLAALFKQKRRRASASKSGSRSALQPTFPGVTFRPV